jgi:hypothetical protein
MPSPLLLILLLSLVPSGVNGHASLRSQEILQSISLGRHYLLEAETMAAYEVLAAFQCRQCPPIIFSLNLKDPKELLFVQRAALQRCGLLAKQVLQTAHQCALGSLAYRSTSLWPHRLTNTNWHHCNMRFKAFRSQLAMFLDLKDDSNFFTQLWILLDAGHGDLRRLYRLYELHAQFPSSRDADHKAYLTMAFVNVYKRLLFLKEQQCLFLLRRPTDTRNLFLTLNAAYSSFGGDALIQMDIAVLMLQMSRWLPSSTTLLAVRHFLRVHPLVFLAGSLAPADGSGPSLRFTFFDVGFQL